mgnify:CR=1 FL=1
MPPIRGTTSPSSRYEVQATLDFADELFLARYCSCPAFSGSQRGYGSYRTFDYHNSPKYRSFDDDDDYDYVDDYDDFGSGSTYGHVNDDDDSASSTSRRYTGMCKHVAAMLLLFLQQPERFRGFHAAAATPRALADYMRSLDAKSNNAGENAQLDVLKRIINAKSRLIEEQRGASGQGAAKPKRKSSAPVDVKPGSVYLEPTLINGHDALRLSLRIGCGDADYALKNISRFVADMRTGTYESYGKKLAFTHTPDMLDPFSLKLYRFLQQVIASRTAAQLQNGYYYGEAVRVDRELVLTDWEACDLLDLFHAVTQDEYKEHESKARGFLRTSDGDGLRRLLIEDFQRTKESGPSRIHMANEGGEPFGLDIVEGDPTFTFKASYVHEGTASGVRITSNQSISDVINGRNGFYVFSRERPDDSTATDRIGIDGLFRCTDKLRPALQVLPDLCSDDPDGVFIAENDWPMFARTIVPKLTEAGIGFDIPQEVTEAVGTECRIEFYLDRDLYGITCEAVAKYGDFTFQLVPTAKELRGVINPDSRSRASQVKRDLSRESFAVQVVRQLCPTWSSIDVARVKEEDEQAILLMLTDGVQILKSVGQVFSTAAFDGMMQPNPPSVKVGLSIDSNLVEISPIADEVPMNEVGALLDSYRRKRRYHRLKNGTFVDLKEADLHELDQVSTDLDLSEKQLDSGIIKIPGYQAFLLDSQVDDEGKSASFVDYVNDVKIVDPKRYEVPERLKTVLRPYQVEGFQWLSTLWDKGFGGILADEMGLGKSVQLLSLIEARKGNGPSLIVCPASLVLNWQEECQKFTPQLSCVAVDGDAAHRAELAKQWAEADLVVTSYDLMRRDEELYSGQQFYACILDEAQAIKNHTTQKYKAVCGVNSKVRFALTGTPVENRLGELWSIFSFLMPGYLPPYKTFCARFEKPIVQEDDKDALRRLNQLTGPFILRRMKSEVLKELPPKTENLHRIELDEQQRKLYLAAVVDAREKLRAAKPEDKMAVFAVLMRLREICCDPRLVADNWDGGSAKLEACMELVTAAVEGGHRILLFSQFTSMLELLAKRLDEAGVSHFTLQGSTPKPVRAELVRRFNSGEADVFLISLRAGGTGLNLTAADIVIHYDPWWNVAAQNQATDRAYRIGQRNPVQVYKLIAQDTIEEKIVELQQAKQDLAETVTGSADGAILSMKPEELLQLLKEE